MMLAWMKYVAKALLGFAVPVVGGLAAATTGDSPGGDGITGGEWLAVLGVGLATAGAVFGVKNGPKPAE